MLIFFPVHRVTGSPSLIPRVRTCALPRTKQRRTTANHHPATTRSTSIVHAFFPHFCLDPACCLDPMYPFTMTHTSCPRGGVIGCVSPKESTLPCRVSHSRTSSGSQCCQTYGECIQCIKSGMNTMPNRYHEDLRAFLKGVEIPEHQTRPQTLEVWQEQAPNLFITTGLPPLEWLRTKFVNLVHT